MATVKSTLKKLEKLNIEIEETKENFRMFEVNGYTFVVMGSMDSSALFDMRKDCESFFVSNPSLKAFIGYVQEELNKLN